MTKQLNDYYRLPEPWVQVASDASSVSPLGYFNFGDGITGFGRCAAVSPEAKYRQPIPDAYPHARIGTNQVHLPFDLEDVVTNLRSEKYLESQWSGLLGMMTRHGYYSLRPLLNVGARKYLQRMYLAGWQKISFPRWPIDRSVDRILEQSLALAIKASGSDSVPFIWFWPEDYRSCAIVTHDVEAEAGRDFCSTLMDLDDSCGVKSAFQVIPEERYVSTPAFLEGFGKRGFELNVHDLNHDGLLFSSRKIFEKRAPLINRYGKEFGARGFRSGAMYRNQEWIQELDFDYDMSVPCAAHLEPQRGGCCTTLPYFNGRILELPLTTTQDYGLFHILGKRTLELWQSEIEALYQSHSLISILVHPDYILQAWAQELYLQLLRYVTGRASADHIWLATPGQVNDWWQLRSSLSLVPDGDGWRIAGDPQHRARVAYARLDGDTVRYGFTPPGNKDSTSTLGVKTPTLRSVASKF